MINDGEDEIIVSILPPWDERSQGQKDKRPSLGVDFPPGVLPKGGAMREIVAFDRQVAEPRLMSNKTVGQVPAY